MVGANFKFLASPQKENRTLSFEDVRFSEGSSIQVIYSMPTLPTAHEADVAASPAIAGLMLKSPPT